MRLSDISKEDFRKGFVDGVTQWYHLLGKGKIPEDNVGFDDLSPCYQNGWIAALPLNAVQLGVILGVGIPVLAGVYSFKASKKIFFS